MTSNCRYCRVEFDKSKHRRYTRDHVWPRSRFVQPNTHGCVYLRRSLNYTVAACATCNTDKGGMTPREWLAVMDADDIRRPHLEAVIRKFPTPPPTKPGSRGEFEEPARRSEMPACPDCGSMVVGEHRENCRVGVDQEHARLRMFFARMESLARVPGGSLPGTFASVAVECRLLRGDVSQSYHPSSHQPTVPGGRALMIGRGLLEEGA